jgi:ketosteroid isomerase-like protein
MVITGSDGSKRFHERYAMEFDGGKFLSEMAEAYNTRDAMRLYSFFALDDHRFCLFEEFSGELLYGGDYKQILSLAEEATGVMFFEELDCRVYGEYAILHAIQRVVHETGGKGSEEAQIRATLFVSLEGRAPRILTGHFSSMMLCFPKRETVIRWPRLE